MSAAPETRLPTAALLAIALTATGCLGGGPPGPGGGPDLALGRPAVLLDAQGDAATVTDGRLAPEGGPPAGTGVGLGGVGSAVVVDLGAVHSLGAVLLQAGAADVYYVEASTDQVAWALVWSVAPLHGQPGLRTRTTRLPRPVAARWLRVRSTTARAAAVAELQAYEAEPVWPRLDLSRPDAALPLWPALGRDSIDAVYQALAALLMLAAAWALLARGEGPQSRGRRLRRGSLVVLGGAALLGWPNLLNFHYYGALHKWEFFHYYLGGKYLPELGYTRLYLCAALVDTQDGIDLGDRAMRDLRDNRKVPARAELARGEECRSRFSAARWEEFRHDARFFRAWMGQQAWEGARNDHGFNGTPAWAVVGGLGARAPASTLQMQRLACLDAALLLASFALIGLGFGLEAACLAAGFFGLNALAPFGWTGGAFLRYDWLFCLVAGVAALRAGRPALAGFALGWASLLRVFPACALAGVALGAGVEAVARRRGRPLLRPRLLAGVAAAAVLGLACSWAFAGRASIWGEFARNSAKHLASEAFNSVGLRPFLAHQHATRLELLTDPLLLDPPARWEKLRSEAERRTRLAAWTAGAAFALLLCLALRGEPDWVAAVLGMGLVPLLLTLSSYYYAFLIVYAMLWRRRPGAGLGLAGLAWASQVVMRLWSGQDDRYAWLSLAVVAFTTLVTVRFAGRGQAAPPAPALNRDATAASGGTG